MQERRKYKRFSATAFLQMPVSLVPCPPFFGRPIKGRMIDLSAGGLALLIDEIIPLQARLKMSLTFPDGNVVEALIQVRRALPKGKKYLIGMEFIEISEAAQARINQMSTDYIDCESRIQEQMADVCRTECAFFSMCTKPQRKDAVPAGIALELYLKALDHSAVS